MHIQQIQIDRLGQHRELSVDNLTSGLNVIHGAPASGKTRVADFVRSLIHNRTNASSDVFADSGSAILASGSGRYQVHRKGREFGSSLTVAAYDSQTADQPADQVLPRISDRLFEKVFHIAFRHGCDIEAAVCESEAVLNRTHADAVAIRDAETHIAACEARRVEWLRSDEGESPLDRNTRRREALTDEIAGLESQWGDRNIDVRRRRDELEQLARIREGSLADANRQIDGLDAEITTLETEHQELIRQYEALQRGTDPKLSKEIQSKLKKITEQMLRWNRVLVDVVERRDRIRAELVEWATGNEDHGELGESARRIAAMEQLLHDITSEVKKFRKSDRCVSHCGCRKLHESCDDALHELRDHLYDLCEDLSREQYKYRRSAMNSELKQLRRCHGEVTQYLQRLVKRRNQLLKRLGQADPAALSDVIREQRELCEVEDNEALFDLVSVKSVDVSGDWEDVQRRLGELDYQLEELRAKRIDASREAEKHRDQLAEIRAELNSLGNEYDLESIVFERRRELSRLEQEHSALLRHWQTLTDELTTAKNRLEQLRASHRSVQVLAEGSHFLRELTGNDYVAISRSPHTARLVVESRSGKVFAWEELPQQVRDLAHLSVCLAAVARLAREGVYCPMVVDDLFAHVEDDRVPTVAGVLKRFGESGKQILATCGWESAAVRCEAMGVAVRQVSAASEPVVVRQPTAPEPLEPVAEPTFGDGIPDDTYYLERTDPIDEAPDVTHEDALALRSHGVDTVGEFLEMKAEDLGRWSDVRMTTVQLKRCQSLAELLCDVINLRPYDVRILVGSGIQNASQLRRMTSEQLLSRVESFVRTTEGRAILVSGDDFELARVANWIRSARESREFHRETERQQALRRSKERSRAERSGRLSLYSGRGGADSGREAASDQRNSSTRTKRSSSSRKSKSRAPAAKSNESLRFHLERSSDVEAAPSIGPKMAEHLAKIQVISVGDLLDGDAEDIAAELEHRRVNTETVRLWQRQAEWVCRVPEIRGHDAQLLVACGYETVEAVEGTTAAEVFDAVQRIVDTKEGRRILRGGKEPDLNEISDWLEWSKHSRSLRAA